MDTTTIKPSPIRDIDDIELIKIYLQKSNDATCDRHLLYFILGINTCLKPDKLLKLRWSDILDIEKETINDFIIYNDYKFYLNLNCKTAIYNYIQKYDCFKLFPYVFGNNRPIVIQTMNKVFSDIKKELGLPYILSSLSLHKTFIYWQIYYNNKDYIKMSKLNHLIHKSTLNNDLNSYSEYDIKNDYLYINDVNL